jgi:hypothetical protein
MLQTATLSPDNDPLIQSYSVQPRKRTILIDKSRLLQTCTGLVAKILSFDLVPCAIVMGSLPAQSAGLDQALQETESAILDVKCFANMTNRAESLSTNESTDRIQKYPAETGACCSKEARRPTCWRSF